ncbi:MAG: hypothetical protein IH986_07475 [Planctomycetes bacterium]|nr:hypothetical protein [Planctomycetota bacterium]
MSSDPLWKLTLRCPFGFAWTREKEPLRAALNWTAKLPRLMRLPAALMLVLTYVWWTLAIGAVRSGYPLRLRRYVSPPATGVDGWHWATVPLAAIAVWSSIGGLFYLWVAHSTETYFPESLMAFLWPVLLRIVDPFSSFQMIAVPVAYIVAGQTPMFLSLLTQARSKRLSDEDRVKRLRRAVDEQYKQANDVDEQALDEFEPGWGKMDDAVLAERRQLHLVNKSDFFIQARDTLLGFLPAYPRHVKRVLNRLRVLLWVAHRRKLFEQSGLTAPMLGKWVALQEGWPELANAIMRRPQALKEIEARAGDADSDADVDTFANQVRELAPLAADPQGLKKLLAGEPHLADVIDALTRFEPTPPETNTTKPAAADS